MSRFSGGCKIEVHEGNIAGFFNKAAEAGIDLSHIKREDGSFFAEVYIEDLPLLRRISEECGCFFTVKDERGLARVRRRWHSHKLVICAVVLILVTLAIFPNSIIQVELGNSVDGVDGDEVLAIAAEYGIKPTFFSSFIDYDGATAAILKAEPNLTWVGFQKNGVKITINMVERIAKNSDNDTIGDIVAKKDGFVRQVLVYRGQQVVALNTPVKKGDVLISGRVTILNRDNSESSFVTEAEGTVVGSVWYNGESYCSFVAVNKEETGRSCAYLVLEKPGDDVILWGTDKCDYADFVLEEGESLLNCHWVTIKEVRPVTHELTKKEAVIKATRDAKAEALKKIPKGAEVKNEKVEEVNVNGAIGVKYTVEVQEELGVFKKAQTGDES